jgi:hypothetical protein
VYYERWASKSKTSFNQVCKEKEIEFMGYFSCMGAPSPPIEEFIHNTIIEDEVEWAAYIKDVSLRPDNEDLDNARSFAKRVFGMCQAG